MESHTAVRIVLRGPEEIGAYWRRLVMDDDTITPAHLSEENKNNPKCKGKFPKDMAEIFCCVDSLHQKRTIKTHLYKLADKKVKYFHFTTAQAVKLGKYIGY